MSNTIEHGFILFTLKNMLAAKGRSVDLRGYANCKYYKLYVGNDCIAEFNCNYDGFIDYAINNKCYTGKRYKELKKLCPKADNRSNEQGWHTRSNGYYGRTVNKGGYTIEDDKQYILKCAKLYLDSLE